jgi:hypothetical protein
MKRLALILLCAAPLAIIGPSSATGSSNDLLISFTGFDFESPNPSAAYLDVGEGYEIVGLVTGAGPLLAPWIDLSSYEYTIHIHDLTVTGHLFVSPNFLFVTFANNGRIRYYADNFPADGGTAATYGTNPPNATASSTFIDGTSDPNTGERITGDVDELVLFYNFSINHGSCGGKVTLDGGPDLVYLPPGYRSDWELRLDGQTNSNVPAGYDHQVDGDLRLFTSPAAHRTWGALKALYR